ncbi:hypothetical protein OH77DRAFT_1428392 [Trametes cingulata]|nr:hypothetical protein OH77DRAFT_1428392 [Trametes cingulata]
MPRRSKRARTSIANLRQHAQKRRKLDLSPTVPAEPVPTPSPPRTPTITEDDGNGSLTRPAVNEPHSASRQPDRPTGSPGSAMIDASAVWPSRNHAARLGRPSRFVCAS